MKYHIIAASNAPKCLELHRAENHAAIDELVLARGTGEDFDIPGLTAALEDLWSLAKTFKTPKGHLAPRDPRGGEFESKGCEILHKRVPLPRRIAGDRDFWTWMTFAAEDGGFAPLIDWRFGPGASPDNYGITTPGSFREGLLARLWWRADIGHVNGEADPYHFARIGDQDIWRSHVFRTRYGRDRSFARAFLTSVFEGMDRKEPRIVERTMAKLARARHAGTALEVLTAVQRDGVMDELRTEAQALCAGVEE